MAANPLHVAPQHRQKAKSAAYVGRVNCSKPLGSGKSLVGTPTVEEWDVDAQEAVDPQNLTLTSPSISTEAETIDGQSVPAGQAIKFHIGTGGTVGTTYAIRVKCNDDTSPTPRTIVGRVYLEIVPD